MTPRLLTLTQPFATLIALREKAIETRGYRTPYRGDIWIHAGAKYPPIHSVGDRGNMFVIYTNQDPVRLLRCSDGEWIHAPLGAVVAVARLVDIAPIFHGPDWHGTRDAKPGDHAITTGFDLHNPDGDTCEIPLRVWRAAHDGLSLAWRPQPIQHEEPFGIYTPGRYGWLLDNIRPLTRPVPCRGHQGLRTHAEHERLAPLIEAALPVPS